MINIGDLITGTIQFNTSGSAYIVNPDLPKDIYIHKSKTNKSFHLDTVRVKIKKGIDRNIEGEVIEIIKRFKEEFVGTIQLSDRYAFFVPDSNKMNVDFFIPLSKLNGVENGQKVVAKMTEWKDDAKNPNGEVVRVIGDAGNLNTEIHSILEEYGLPYEFDAEVLLEADAISGVITQAEIDKRKDMRSITTIGIDPHDSKDADDTLSIEWIGGDAWVSINIADVTHYLRPETELDREAFNRGTSVYLVDRCIPMLPERLSNGICSLKAGSDKLCFTASFRMDKRGYITDKWFGKTIINVDKDYSYEQAQEVIENGVSEDNKITDQSVLDLNRLAKILRKERFKHGVLSLDRPEVRFILDDNNKPVDVVFKTSKDSNKLIEEFMLLANKEVAKFIKSKGLPCVNRVHEAPTEEKVTNLKEFMLQFGYDVKISNPDEIKSSLNKLLKDSKGKPEENLVSNLVTRAQQKAIYTTKALGHYGLGFTDYSHFTSPIRRYSDIKTHQLLTMALEKAKEDSKKTKSTPNVDKLEMVCKHLSDTEKKAQKADRASDKYMHCLYLQDNIGKVYTGMVSSILDFGVFVEIKSNGCEGCIRLSDIDGDVYIADVANYCVRGQKTGDMIRVGDEVTIVVKSVDLEKKNINLTLIRL